MTTITLDFPTSFKKTLFIGLLLILALHVPIFCQVNTEALRKSDISGLRHTVDLNWQVNGGSSSLFTLDGTYRVDYRQPGFSFFALGYLKKSESRALLIGNEGFGHARLTHGVWEGFLQRSFNDFRRLARRDLIGGGVRLPMKIDSLTAHIGLGVMNENESVIGEGESTVIRSTNYLSFGTHFSKIADWSGTIYYQPLPSNLNDFRILTDQSLSVSLSKRVALTISLFGRYDSTPPTGVSVWDVSIKNGIRLRF